MEFRLLTIREIVEKEIEHRLIFLKMPKRKVAKSLGYSEKGFRLMLKQLEDSPEYRPRVNNSGERKLAKRKPTEYRINRKLPRGVISQGNKFQANITINKIKYYLGLFDTKEEAESEFKKVYNEWYGDTKIR